MSLLAVRSEGALPVTVDAQGDASRQRPPTLQHVSSEGSLSPVKRQLHTDGSVEATKDNLTETLSPLRRRGLSNAEKLCMRRIPQASPQYSAKMADWCRSHGSEASLHALPSDPPSMSTSSSKRQESNTGQRPRVRAVSQSPHAAQDPQSPQKSRIRARTLATGTTQDAPLGSWDAQEQCMARILRNVFPSTLTGMNFFKPGVKINSSSSAPQLHAAHAADSVVRISPLTMKTLPVRPLQNRGRSSSKMSASSSVNPAASASSSVNPAPVHQASDLQFIRREAHWDVKMSAIGDKALRLIQGAAKTRETFQSIRRKALAQSSATCQKAFIWDVRSRICCLQGLRIKILESYSCVQDAFRAIAVDDDGDLDKREWCSALDNANFCGIAEGRAIYDLVDANRDGTVSPTEFLVAITMIAQVTTMEILRKRLICLGFRSMTQALTMMNGSSGSPDTTMQPLTFEDFAAALGRVHVVEPMEHKAIFDAVRDPGDPAGRASLSDLACALAVVSPSLLLEDIRMRMMDEDGSIDASVRLLSADNEVSGEEFKRNACNSFGLNCQESEVLFKSIDLDSSGEVSQDEIRRALNLAEASLDLEDCRRKLRQGYLSIQAAFREAYATPEEVEHVPDEMYFGIDEFADVLRPLGLGKENVTCLIELMCVSVNGVTIPEFFSGANLFAPSCVLEELKMQLLRTHQNLEVAFRNVKDRRSPLTRDAFKSLLQKLGAHCDNSDQIFDFLDIRCAGVTTVSEMIAALQCLQCGSHKHLSPTEFKASVDSNVSKVLNPFFRFASQLKASVKEDATPLRKTHSGAASPSSAAEELDSRVAKAKLAATSDDWGETAARSENPIPKKLMARRTFLNIASKMHVLPPVKEQENMGRLTSYFGSNEDALSEQRRLSIKCYRRSEEHQIVEKLKKGATSSRMQRNT